jgi:hypothetical protein
VPAAAAPGPAGDAALEAVVALQHVLPSA